MTAVATTAPRRLSGYEIARQAAEGAGTVVRSIRVTPTGQDDSVSTMLSSELVHPPSWIEQVVQEVLPAKDEYNLINLETMVRFVRACAALPADTPRPFVDIGDDATVVAEWDIGVYHLGMQVGNNSEVDSLILEGDDGLAQEVPLARYILAFAEAMAEVVAR